MKIKVGVFFGGKSVEHEVSVISAMQAIAALDAEKYARITRIGCLDDALRGLDAALSAGFDRVKLNAERVQYWLGQGAQPTDRVARFLEAAGLKAKTVRNNPKAAVPGKAMAARAAKKAARAAAPAEE